jgi:hypothetical protein
MAGPTNVLIKIGAETSDAVRGLKNVESSLGKTMTKGEKATAALHKAAVPAAAALAAIGYAAVDAGKAAMEDAAASDKLAHQLQRVTGATDKQVKSAEDYITKLSMQTGVADDELRPALGKLATATGDLGKSQKSLALALDISAHTGKSLDSVSTALAKAYGGQTTALQRLVPGMDQTILASKDMTKITEELARLTGGAATEAAQTAEGQYKVLTVRMQELKEALGAGLIPVVEAFLPLLNQAAQFAADNTKAIKILVGIVAGLSAGILAANAAIKAYKATMVLIHAATKAWTAVQWLLNAALSGNPIGLVIVAVAALTTAFVVAYQKSETFRRVVSASMDGVRSAVSALGRAFDQLKDWAAAAWNWIAAHWKVGLFAFGPIGAAVYVISENFDRVRQAAAWAANVVASAWNLGKFGFNAIIGALHSIADAFSRIASYCNSAIAAVQNLIGWLGRIRVPDIKLPHIGKKTIPGLVYPVGVPASRVAGAAATSGAGGVTINVYGAVDPEGTARTIRRLLNAHDRRQGRTFQ